MQLFRFLLFPFSFVYYLITSVRNLLYDWKIFKAYTIPIPSICVGNLSVGGTGKTPHVAYLAELLGSKHTVSILSRGYGRSTKGYRLLHENDHADQVGDEPLFYVSTLPQVDQVVVCEKRKTGVEKIIEKNPNTSVILLDDAFQHRAVKAGLNLLITDYSKPFFKDYLMPLGTLRESRNGKERADVIIVSKTPKNLTQSAKNKFVSELKIEPSKIFFSSIEYGDFRCFGQPRENPKQMILVTGIANPKPLEEYLRPNFEIFPVKFPDHYAFKAEDIAEIHQKLSNFGNETIILTTEKDFMRLKSRTSDWKMNQFPWYYVPITVSIDREVEFKEIINGYVKTLS